MPVDSGTMVAHYRLIEKIGEGGMGEVWRAADTTLDRDVAIKILPAAFAADPERLARFEREAKVLASLNHPNIAAIYGLHEADGVRFLAMELVPGEDLAERLGRGPMPVDEAIDAAKQIAAALSAAHDSGDRPPRSETREHEANPRRHGQGARLRPREGPRRPWGRRSAQSATITSARKRSPG